MKPEDIVWHLIEHTNNDNSDINCDVEYVPWGTTDAEDMLSEYFMSLKQESKHDRNLI